MPVQQVVAKSANTLQKTQRVIDFDDIYVRRSIEDLLDSLAAHQIELDKLHPGMGGGVGLSANQIAYPAPRYPKDFIPFNIYVVSVRAARAARENCEMVSPTVLINAACEILPTSVQQKTPESCLSLVGILGLDVPRNTAIRVIANDDKGREICFEARDFLARLHQHEQDHCQGREYLHHLHCSPDDLVQIANWIDKNRNISRHPEGTVIIKNLVCTGDPLDYAALKAWVDAQK